ncbi:RsiV family protein [Listeria sp. PSOL-1]|uniref:RsiV family protein n=1 Tax=Listeria sp. PSOL-1 TaxID=1844999 RepID=UPI0013CF737E|nr:RsiV family protein [Listeria sp. PSOL-1]
MNRNESFEKMRQEYKMIPIPSELDQIIYQAKQMKKKREKKYFFKWGGLALPVCIAIFLTMVSTNEPLARAMLNVPVLKNIVGIITGQNYQEKTASTNATVKTPKLKGLQDKTFEDEINHSYIQTGNALFAKYKKYVNENGTNYSVASDFKEVTNTNRLLAIKLTIEEVRASSYVENQYLTIDKEKQQLITLNRLFKNEDYLQFIQQSIKKQMNAETKKDPQKVYLKGKELESVLTAKNLSKKFYITNQNKLVISFSTYEVAPGYMGAVEFQIPTQDIASALTNHDYIK